jgi:SAM-dependent methyltransferase
MKTLRARRTLELRPQRQAGPQSELRRLDGLPAVVSCPACGSPGTHTFHEQRGIPVHATIVLESREEALQHPTGDMELAWCRSCGFISNTRFDDRLLDYAGRHEESQGFSPRFQKFAKELARRWIDRYDLAGKTVLEIGCGKGYFLELMVSEGVGRGIGVDPGCDPGRATSVSANRIDWIKDYFSPIYAEANPDAIVCRHTLEHIHDVTAFLQLIRLSVSDRRDVVVLFEVPDALCVLQAGAFWDVYYEHCGYFTPGSLARTFRSAGFDILDVERVYSGQYLVIEMRPRPEGHAAAAPLPLEESPAVVEAATAVFASTFRGRIATWQTRLRQARAERKRGVIWGGGSKGMGYLTALGPDAGIDFVVDINPHLQGRYMPGTGQQVVGPEILKEYQPDFVIIMNAVYLDEIRAMLLRMDLDPVLLTA